VSYPPFPLSRFVFHLGFFFFFLGNREKQKLTYCTRGISVGSKIDFQALNKVLE
jgi:hypothetical protein